MSVFPAVGVIHSECVVSSTPTVSVSQPGLDLGLTGTSGSPIHCPPGHEGANFLFSISFILKLETILFMHFLYCQKFNPTFSVS